MDSTLGPYIGRISRTGYVRRAIDREKSLYPNWVVNRPGRIKDMYQTPGILDLQSIPCESIVPPGLELMAGFIGKFKKSIGYDNIMKNITRELSSLGETDPGVVCTWPGPLECPALADGWTIKNYWLRGGCNTAEKEWLLVRNNTRLNIKISVS
ncbi:MAG: hypothetical protein GY940_19545, partial [bacterium]|nr:hypothetical protein [bacterium]